MAKEPSVWVVALVDSKFIDNLFEDLLKKPKYKIVEAYIPTMKVLQKQVKGKKYFKDVPLLLNYGFFKVPRYFVPNFHFLNDMKKDIRCIYNWLIDPTIDTKKASYYQVHRIHNPMGVALADGAAVNKVRDQENLKTIYTEKDLETLYKGQCLTLQSYPFDGLPARVETIDHGRKRVEVKLLLETPLVKQSKIWVSFENIFFTKYMDDYVDGPMKEQSIEEINARKTKGKHTVTRDGSDQ